jgi:hypothetical protein
VEHSADLACEKAHRGGCLDVLALAAEGLARRRLGVDRMNLAAWDASVAVRQDASADGNPALPLLGVGVEKLVVPEQAAREPDGWTSVEWVVLAAVPLLLAALPLVSAELGKPAAVPSAAQSCAAPEFADEPAKSVQRDVEPEPRY